MVSVSDGRLVCGFKGAGEKELGINLSIANELVTVDGLQLSKEQIALLKNESRIRSAVAYGEKAILNILTDMPDLV